MCWFPKSPLKIHWRPQTLGFLGDLQATSPGHHVPAGNLHGKNKYVIHIRNLKVALNHRLVLKILHKVIKFNHNFMAKIIHRNEHRVQKKKVKSKSEKDFFTLMNNSDFGKTMENIRKHRDIKFVTTEKRRNYLVFKPNYHSKKFFTQSFLATKMKKTQIFMNKPAYLSVSILELSKTVIYKFWYDYIKLKYKEKARLYYMDTDIQFCCLYKNR